MSKYFKIIYFVSLCGINQVSRTIYRTAVTFILRSPSLVQSWTSCLGLGLSLGTPQSLSCPCLEVLSLAYNSDDY